MNLNEATREIMWNINKPIIMYILAAISLGIFAFGMYKRVSLWRKGKADGERLSDFGKRFWLMLKEVLLQNRVVREKFPGVFHSFIFFSFVILVITTGVIAIDYDLGTSFFNGYLYILLSFLADLAGFFILVGIGMAMWRRYLKRPKSLENGVLDGWALAIIGLMVLTGFFVEAIRIATIEDPWKLFSPFGYILSFPFMGIAEESAKTLHSSMWWIHTVIAFVWIASIPFTKFFHILAMPANVFFAKLTPRGALPHQDIEAIMSAEDFDEENFSIGVKNASDFSWKQRMDFDACVSCGRCEEICPSSQADQPFSPRRLIAALKETVYKEAKLGGEPQMIPEKSVGAAAVSAHVPVVGEAFDENFIWYCRTCTACMEVCPAFIEHADTLMEIRRNEVIMEGRIPGEAARALRSLESLGNPFGPQSDRIDWISKLGVRVVKPGEECDVIYWIGCCTTFDPTKNKIASDLCKLLQKCGIEFGVLGEDEKCCGDPARLLGQEHLFQEVVKKQIEEIDKRKFKILLVSCPHCYNVLKNEYSQFGGNYNVVHHSEFLHEMIWSGAIKPIKGEVSKIVYHDPCYLGRFQKIYDSPREAIKAVPGATITEMKNNRERSFCCGGGGGHFWMDIKEGKRINNLRVEQAAEVGADTIATSCAYCMQMLNDSVKAMNYDDRMKVTDIATIILNSLEDEGASEQ